MNFIKRKLIILPFGFMLCIVERYVPRLIENSPGEATGVADQSKSRP